MSAGALLRRGLIVVLAAGVAYGGWRLASEEPVEGAPPDVAAAPFPDDPEATLRPRFDRLVELRLADDWIGLYELVDPAERERLPLPDFLGFYGRGHLKTLSIQLEGIEVDPEARIARVATTTETVLQVHKLPAKFRDGLKDAHPEDLFSRFEHEVIWTWKDGDWFFRLDPEIVAGRTATGQDVRPHTGESEPLAGGTTTEDSPR